MVKKRTVKSTKATKTEKPVKSVKSVKKDKKQMTETMNTVGTKVSRTVNLGDFESVKIEFSLNKNIKMDADVEKELDGIFEIIEAKVDEKLEKYEEVPEEKEVQEEPEEDEELEEEEDSEEEEGDSEEDGDDDDGEEDSEEDDEISEEAIMAMNKKELAALIKESGLTDEVNPKEFKKIGELRKAVIDAMFEEDGDDSEDGGDEWDDDEWADD